LLSSAILKKTPEFPAMSNRFLIQESHLQTPVRNASWVGQRGIRTAFALLWSGRLVSQKIGSALRCDRVCDLPAGADRPAILERYSRVGIVRSSRSADGESI
jgi:hypothetical protein